MEHGPNDRNQIGRDDRFPFLDYYAVMNRVREGTLSNGERFKPFAWLEVTTMPKPKQQLTIERAMESCTFKTLLSCAMGTWVMAGRIKMRTKIFQTQSESWDKFLQWNKNLESLVGMFLLCLGYALGAAFGLITSGMDPAIAGDVGQPSKLNTRETLREIGKRSSSYARNFAMFGAMYSGTECMIETYRGKSDLANSGLAGCATGGVIGLRAGVTAGVIGCGGFAAFSLAIDYFLRR